VVVGFAKNFDQNPVGVGIFRVVVLFGVGFDSIRTGLESFAVGVLWAVYLKLPAHQKILPVGFSSIVPSE
jgi:hypothetical protein